MTTYYFGELNHELVNQGTAGGSHTHNYKCVSVAGGKYSYQLQDPFSITHGFGRNIEYDSTASSPSWNANPSTDGSNDPARFITSSTNFTTVIPTGSSTSLFTAAAGNTFYGEYSVDYTANPGSGGIITHGTSVNSIFIESNGEWVGGTIAESEPNGSYPVTLNSNLLTPAITHTTGTETSFSIPILSRFGTWHLHQNYVTSALNTPIASVLVSERGKKVFCNFW